MFRIPHIYIALDMWQWQLNTVSDLAAFYFRDASSSIARPKTTTPIARTVYWIIYTGWHKNIYVLLKFKRIFLRCRFHLNDRFPLNTLILWFSLHNCCIQPEVVVKKQKSTATRFKYVISLDLFTTDEKKQNRILNDILHNSCGY